jgi:hypothetical protein
MSGANPPCFNSGIGADLAEFIQTSEALEPGDLVEFDPEHPKKYRKSRSAYSQTIAGIISTKPGLLMALSPVSPRAALALAGRVPVKATTENGPISPGDLLVSSSKPGYAMRCADLKRCEGAIVGKALEALSQGEGRIAVLVTGH